MSNATGSVAVAARWTVPLSSRRPSPAEWAAVLGLAVPILLLPFAPVAADQGFTLFTGQRLLQGERLYIDIGADVMHPPLQSWLMTGVVWVAQLLRLPGWIALFGLTTIAALLSIFASYRLAFRSPLLLVAFGAALIAWSGAYYGGGEQLTLIGLLPYLAAAARTADGRPPDRRVAVAVGLAAGLGLALKPHYAVVWLGVESYLAARRSWRSFLRPESLVILATWAVYILATALLTPAFFRVALWAIDVYPAFHRESLATLLTDPTGLVLGGVGAFILLARPVRLRAHLARIAWIAAAAMWLTAVVQGKGWYFHWMPSLALACVALGALAPARASWRLMTPAALFGALIMGALEVRGRLDRQAGGRVYDRIAAAMRAVAPHGPVLALTQEMVFMFPTINDLGAEWSSPFASLWMLPPMSRDGDGRYRYPSAAEWSPTQRLLFNQLWRAVRKRPPRVVVVEGVWAGQPFDFRRCLETDPRLRALLAGFEPAARVGTYEILRRKPGFDSTVAIAGGAR